MMNLGTVIAYQKKIQKTYKLHVHLLNSADIWIFSLENSNFSY